jgi:hypothetical protein
MIDFDGGVFIVWNNIFTRKAEDWTFQSLEANQIPDGKPSQPILADQSYIKIFLRSMRIVDVRKGLKKFYGVVHSFISLPHLEKTAEFQVITTPKELMNIDASNVDRVLQFNKVLVDSVPYRGGGVEIELGLFSIQSVDLTDSFLEVLEGMADAAGVSFVSTAMPFVGPLRKGINLLFGNTNSSILEVGVATTMDKPSTGYFVIMRAPKGEVDLSEYELDQAYRLVDKQGKTIEKYPYMVFSVEAGPDREKWFEIPDIAKAYKTLRQISREGNIDKAQEAFVAFKRIVLTSPDLLDQDADNLVQKAQEKLNRIFSTQEGRRRTPTRGGIDEEKIELDSLDKIDLYSK